MIGQEIITIVVAVITVGGTLGGIFLGSHISKRKIVSEKIEEIYTLSTQIQNWFDVQLWHIQKIAAIETPFDEAPNKAPFWYVDDSFEEPACPIGRLVSLVNLHVPSLKNEIEFYRSMVLRMQSIQHAMKKEGVNKIVETLMEELYASYLYNFALIQYMKEKRINTKVQEKKANNIFSSQRKKLIDEYLCYEKMIVENDSGGAEQQHKKLVKDVLAFGSEFFAYHHKHLQSSLEKLA